MAMIATDSIFNTLHSGEQSNSDKAELSGYQKRLREQPL